MPIARTELEAAANAADRELFNAMSTISLLATKYGETRLRTAVARIQMARATVRSYMNSRDIEETKYG